MMSESGAPLTVLNDTNDVIFVSNSQDTVTSTTKEDKAKARNAEHARRTRQRKKLKFASLQERLVQLQQEQADLQARVSAGILLDIARAADREVVPYEKCIEMDGGDRRTSEDAETDQLLDSPDGYDQGPSNEHVVRKPDDDTPSLEVTLPDGRIIIMGSESEATINWKSGDYQHLARDIEYKLSKDELDFLRRERNRHHARRTRGRRKACLQALEHHVARLEAKNAILQRQLRASSLLNSATPSLVASETTRTSPPSFSLDEDVDNVV